MRPSQITGAKWGAQRQPVPLGCRKAHLEESLRRVKCSCVEGHRPKHPLRAGRGQEEGAGAAPRGTAQTHTSKCPEPGIEYRVRNAVMPHPPAQHTASLPSTTLPPLPRPSSCQGHGKAGLQKAGNSQNRSEET